MKKLFVFCVLFLPLSVFSQRVQMNGIPGQDGGMNITDLLEQIMEPYHTQVSNLINRRTDKEVELEVWTGIRTNIENFDRINRYIFSYESAFRDVTNTVSDPSVLGITAGRDSEKGTHTLVVKRLAAPDAFSSAPIDLAEKLPPSTFSVAVGKASTQISFPGGSISELASALKNTLSNTVDIELINSSDKTRSLLIRGKNMGAEHAITFDGDLKTLRAAKILSEGELKTSEITWSKSGQPLLLTNEIMQKSINTPVSPNTSLTFRAALSKIPPLPEIERAAIAPEGLSPLGEFTNGVQLPGASPLVDDVATVVKEPSEAPQATLTLNFSGGGSERINLGAEEDHLISLGAYAGKNLEKIDISAREMVGYVGTITLTSRPQGALEPFNVISKAQDALFSYDGVDLERPSNSISGLTRGVTIELKKESPDKVSFTISPNLQLIEDTVTQWAMAYNAVSENTYHATTLPIEKIRDRRVKPLHQRKKDGEDFVEGALLSDPGLLSYRSSLRRLVSNPYGSSTNTISLLDQVGIYVQRARGGVPTDPEAVRRGLITMDTAQFKKALNENFDEVVRLFTANPSSENAPYAGVALASSEINASMVGGNGYITRINRDSGDKLRTMSQDIAKKEDELNKTERTERANLLKMNQALAASKAQSESLRQRFGN